jgi:acyl dehydratase
MPEPAVAALVIDGGADLRARAGDELGVSDWYEVTQAAVDAFAACTEDFQWIHVDVDRARESEAGTTIAHGLLTLSLGPRFNHEIFRVEGFRQALNYGYEKVRFPAPVPVNSKLRMRAELVKVDDIAGGVQFTIKQTYEIEGGEKPVCVAESVSRVYAG